MGIHGQSGDVYQRLADKWLILLIHCPTTNVPGSRVSAEHLIEDGRSRKKTMLELVQQGYVTRDSDEADFTVTSKAWDAVVMAQNFDLTKFYKFDAHSANKNANHYITWDSLNFAQKKAVIVALQMDPTSYQLMFVNERYNPTQITPFALGEGGDAREKTGGWSDAKLVVTSEALLQMHKAAQRQHYKIECLNAGLNWFLKCQHANTGVVDVPVCEKQPMFGGYAALDREPAKWEADLPETIKRTQQTIAEAQQRLAALQKLESTVLQMGGWAAFLAKYDAAVDAYVTENMDKPA